MLTRRIQQAALVLLIAGVVGGCGASRPVKYYVLDNGPTPTNSASPQIPVTLLVSRITAASLYRDDRLVFGSGTRAARNLRIRTLGRASGRDDSGHVDRDAPLVGNVPLGFKDQPAVCGAITSFAATSMRWTMSSRPGCAARFSFQLELFDPKSGATLWSGAYTHDEPVTGKSVSDVVAGAGSQRARRPDPAHRRTQPVFRKPSSAIYVGAIARLDLPGDSDRVQNYPEIRVS